MATKADILRAAALGEDSDWEFKSAKGGFPGSFWQTYSAMANSDGGTVLLGVSERNGVVRFDGLAADQIGRHKKTLWDGLNNKGQISRNLLASTNVREADVEADGTMARLLVIEVPRACRVDRPIHVGLNPFGGTYRRSHDGDYTCTEEDVRRMIADASPEPADHRILPNFTIDDFDTPSLTQYRQRFRAAKGDHAWIALDDRELLERLGGWRRDRKSGDDGPTVAGLLMFGKDLAIRDPHAVPHYFVDYREMLDPSTRWTDRIYPDGTWQANLFQFYSRVWPKLAIALTTPFALHGGVRRDDSPAHEALREALVNALIHADYNGAGGIVIERRPDGFMLGNPGMLLVSLDQYRTGGVSECRNRALQQMFLMIGGGERAGSGADKIRSGWTSRSWRVPWITEGTHPDRVRLALTMVSLIPPDTLEGLRMRFGRETVDSLTREELHALATAELEGSVTNARLRSLTTLHPADITKLLQGLCDRGLLEPDGYGRWTSYHLPDSGEQQPPGQRSDLAGAIGPSGNSGHLDANSGPLDASSGLLDANSGLLETSSGPLGDSAPRSREARGSGTSTGELGLSEGEEHELRAIAEPVAGKGKAPKSDVERVIIELCFGRFLSSDQLSKLLDRSVHRLRKDHLSPLVQSGRLHYLHPEAPRSPNQAYTATRPS